MNKKSLILKISVEAVLAAALLLTIIFYDGIYGADSVFAPSLARGVVLNTVVRLVPALITTACAVIVSFFVVQFSAFLTKVLLAHVSNKAKTVLTLVRSLVKWLLAIAVIIISLQAFGVDMPTLLAGLGILALTIGLGAQQIVSDVIAGFFIVFESEFRVGDIVTIEGWRGTVSDIGVRVTKITDASGNVKIINNSDIKSVVNLTAELSVAFLTVSIDYEEDLQKVELVLRDNLAKIKEHIPAILDGPYYKGVTALGSSSVDLLFVATCKETDIFQVKRDINREIFLLFNAHHITIPFNQITVSERSVKPATPAPYKKVTVPETKTGKEAKEFLDEQSELSKEYDQENK